MALLPSPRTSDTNGAGHHGDGGMDLRTAVSGLAASEVERRILAKAQYDMESGCWIWTGWTNQAATPYGRLSVNNVKVYAHRASYEVFIGPIPEGHEIDHLCQTSLCVNPDHLEAVSPEENRDRVTQRRTHCKRGHEFTEENTYWVREGARACRACRARQDVIQKQRKRGVPDDEIVLLPTPACNDMGAAYTPEEWDAWTAEMKAKHNNGNGHGKSLNVEAQRLSVSDEAMPLLPTPVAREGEKASMQHSARKRVEQGHQPFLTHVIADLMRDAEESLLPTPSVADSTGGHERRGGARGEELLLKGVARAVAEGALLPTPTTQPLTGNGHARHLGAEVQPDRWGEYGPAIRRWESLTRPAPEPTKLNAKGNPKLSDLFDEWLMGLPAGWITDVPGVTWNEALKACGNGVVWQQAAAAYRYLRVLAGVAA